MKFGDIAQKALLQAIQRRYLSRVTFIFPANFASFASFASSATSFASFASFELVFAVPGRC